MEFAPRTNETLGLSNNSLADKSTEAICQTKGQVYCCVTFQVSHVLVLPTPHSPLSPKSLSFRGNFQGI